MSDTATQILKVGLVWLQACSDLDEVKLENEVNKQNPTGIGSRWTLPDEEALDGQPQGVDCSERPGFKHYLLNC